MARLLACGTALLVLVGVSGSLHAKPLDLTLEGSVGPYIPDTDPYKGATPLDTRRDGRSAFVCQFGARVRPIFFVSPTLTVFDMFGTLSVGPELGIYTIGSRRLSNAAQCDSKDGLSNDELTVAPMLLSATYRFDWPLERFGFPVVPYARFGLGGAAFMSAVDSGLPNMITDADGKRKAGLGFSFGGKAGVGVMLALDFLEPLRALRARAKNVYKHSYLFLEASGFDAGMYQNWLIKQAEKQSGEDLMAPTLVVGAERLPLVLGGLAISF